MPPFEAAGITPHTLLRALWRQKALGALLWLLATAAVLAAVWSLPRRYRAEAILIAEPVHPLARNAALPSDAELRAHLQLARLKLLQRDRLLGLLRQTWPELVTQWKPADAPREAENLRRRISIATMPESRGRFVAVRIVFEASDPARGAAVTNRLAAELVEEFDRVSHLPSPLQPPEAKAAWARMNECQAALAAFERKHGSDLVSSEMETRGRLALLRAQLAANTHALQRAQTEAVRLEAALAQSTPLPTPRPPYSALRDQPSAESPVVRQLRERLALLLARYRDAHPDVRRLREELLRAQAEIASQALAAEPDALSGDEAATDGSLDAAGSEDLRARLDRARRRVLDLEQQDIRLNAEIAAQQETLRATADLRRQHEALRRECEVAAAAYRAAASKTDIGRPRGASLRLVVLEHALPPAKPEAPNRRLLAILGALFALLPCAAIAAGREIGARPVLTLLGLAPPINGHSSPSAATAAAGRVNGGSAAAAR